MLLFLLFCFFKWLTEKFSANSSISSIFLFCNHPLECTHFFSSFFSSKSSFIDFVTSLCILIVSKFASRKSMDIFLFINVCLPAWSPASNTCWPHNFYASFSLIFLHLLQLQSHIQKGIPRFQLNVSPAPRVYFHQVFSLESLS